MSSEEQESMLFQDVFNHNWKPGGQIKMTANLLVL